MKRYDVLSVLLLPVLTVTVLWTCSLLVQFSFEPGFEHFIFLGLCATAITGEFAFIEEEAPTSNADRGVFSALLVSSGSSALIAYSLIDTQVMGENIIWVLGASMMFCWGCYYRFNARRTLKKHFSHSLRLLDDHRLVVSGPYRLIRHPAYLGTIMIVTGQALLLIGFEGLVLLPIGLIYCAYRMGKEDDMLAERFGDEFLNYRRRSKKLIPYIW